MAWLPFALPEMKPDGHVIFWEISPEEEEYQTVELVVPEGFFQDLRWNFGACRPNSIPLVFYHPAEKTSPVSPPASGFWKKFPLSWTAPKSHYAMTRPDTSGRELIFLRSVQSRNLDNSGLLFRCIRGSVRIWLPITGFQSGYHLSGTGSLHHGHCSLYGTLFHCGRSLQRLQ